MSQGYSIHIGLNHVETSSPEYQGLIVPELYGCLRDAESMEELARAQGFSSSVSLHDGEATAERVLEAIKSAGAQAQAGDIVMITYSGHGSEVPDTEGAGDGGYDQTWVLYDRMLLDRELGALWPTFAPGARIVMVSDSCHSGTVDRDVYRRGIELRTLDATSAHTAAALFARNNPELMRLPRIRSAELSAAVILLAACQDNQSAQDGQEHGLFTQNLLETWGPIPEGGVFVGDYPGFCRAITERMPPTQTPNLDHAGALDAGFEAERPFTVESAMPVAPSANSRDVGTVAEDLTQVLREDLERLRRALAEHPGFAMPFDSSMTPPPIRGLFPAGTRDVNVHRIEQINGETAAMLTAESNSSQSLATSGAQSVLASAEPSGAVPGFKQRMIEQREHVKQQVDQKLNEICEQMTETVDGPDGTASVSQGLYGGGCIVINAAGAIGTALMNVWQGVENVSEPVEDFVASQFAPVHPIISTLSAVRDVAVQR
jgi:hypothetical protein